MGEKLTDAGAYISQRTQQTAIAKTSKMALRRIGNNHQKSPARDGELGLRLRILSALCSLCVHWQSL